MLAARERRVGHIQAFSQNSILGCPFSTRKLDKYATNAENRKFLGKNI